MSNRTGRDLQELAERFAEDGTIRVSQVPLGD